MTQINNKNLIKTICLVLATLLLCAIWFRTADAVTSHAECVVYWEKRTASWANAPTMDKINNDAVYCGNVK